MYYIILYYIYKNIYIYIIITYLYIWLDKMNTFMYRVTKVLQEKWVYTKSIVTNPQALLALYVIMGSRFC